MKTMKNTIKLIGFIALVAVIGFSMAACNNGGGGGGGGKSSSGGTTTGGTTTSVTLNSVTADGGSAQTTTKLTLAFSQAITGLAAADITLSGVTGVTKGTLSVSGSTYTLPITVTRGGTLTVAVAKTGYTIGGSPKTTPIYYYSSSGGSTAVTFSGVTANGNSSTTTTALTLTFSQAITGLAAADITITPSGGASVTKGTLSGTGPTYTLGITVTASGTLSVAVAKSGYTISGSPKTVTIYRSSGSSGSGGGVFGTSSPLAVAYGAGKFVAVGDHGKMAYSADGTNWTAVSNSTFGNNTIFCIVWNGTMFLAGGDYSKMARSTDGISWTAIPNTAFGDDWIKGIAWNGSRFVAVGDSGKIAYSTNAGFTSWTTIPGGSGAGTSNFPDNGNIDAIAYGNGIFVAGGLYNSMAYSTDGISWTEITPSFRASTIIWNGVRFTAGGGSSIKHSNDGKNWTAISNAWDANSFIDGIAYSGSRYVVVGSQMISYSDNGTSWTVVHNYSSNPFLGYFSDVAYGGGKFVAVGYTAEQKNNYEHYGRFIYSTNGTSWTVVP